MKAYLRNPHQGEQEQWPFDREACTLVVTPITAEIDNKHLRIRDDKLDDIASGKDRVVTVLYARKLLKGNSGKPHKFEPIAYRTDVEPPEPLYSLNEVEQIVLCRANE